jgi:hypothetical protein
MLKFTPEDKAKEFGLITSPAVLESVDEEDNTPVYYPIHYVAVEDVDAAPHVAVGMLSGTRFYPIEGAEELKIDEAKGEITFSSYGRIYTIRGFKDSDGVWASALATELPAQALEERYMSEVENAFSPNAPANEDNLYAAVSDETNEVKYLVYSTTSGLFIRDNGSWFKLPQDDETLDDLTVMEVDPKFIKIFDMAQANDEAMLSDDVEKYKVEFRGAIQASALTADADYGDACPPATQDIALNLENRQKAIDNVGYGPLNPAEPNDIFWQDKAERWNTTVREAKTALCGNCIFFIRTPKMLNCLEEGIGLGNEEAQGSIEAGELGYCNALDFKCASERTCNAWAAGGPVVEESQETK